MTKEIICTVCPRGCHITVTGEGERIDSVTGNSCPRGDVYARSEFVCPVRLLCTSVKLEGSERRAMLPIRSTKPIPKSMMFDCMAEVKKVSIRPPVSMHQVIIENIAGSGIDMVASMPIEK